MLNNRQYDIIKWVALIALPALAWLVGGVGDQVGWEYAQMTANIINLFATFIGVLIGVSSYNYNKGE